MKGQRTSLGAVIGSTAVMCLLYVVGVLIGLHDAIIWGLLGVVCGVMVWMVIRILKDPYFTDKTFDEQFYQDRDDLRRSGSEGDL